MNNEIEIGSEWEYKSSGDIVRVVYVNSHVVAYENENFSINSWSPINFNKFLKPHTKQKPPVNLYAYKWIDDGEIRWFIKELPYSEYRQRRPDLDKEISNGNE